MALTQNGFNEPELPLGFGMALMQDEIGRAHV